MDALFALIIPRCCGFLTIRVSVQVQRSDARMLVRAGPATPYRLSLLVLLLGTASICNSSAADEVDELPAGGPALTALGGARLNQVWVIVCAAAAAQGWHAGCCTRVHGKND
jgi:hypothetical protein